ncbi:MAG: MFS transporter [Nanoarchaeota archaeon]
MKTQKIKDNIWKFYLYRIFSSLIFITPIYVLFLQENGLSMTQVMVLHTVYTIATMIFVIPSGLIADHIGRKKVLIISNSLFFIAWIAYGSSHNFWQFFATEIVFGVSSAMWFAAGNAFFYDSLQQINQQHKFKKLYGNVIAINYLMWGLASIVGSIIAVKGFRLVFYYTAIPVFISIIIAFSFTDTKKTKNVNYAVHLKEAVKFTSTHPKIRFLVIFSAIIFGVWLSGYMLYQPYLKSISLPLAYFGIAYFFINLMSAIGSKNAHKIDDKLGETKVLFIVATVFALCYIGMFFSLKMIGAIFPIIIAYFLGVFDVSIADYFHKNIQSYNRATVASLSNFAGQLSSSIIAPFFGLLTDRYDIRTAFMLAFIIIIINIILLLICTKKNGKDVNQTGV